MEKRPIQQAQEILDSLDPSLRPLLSDSDSDLAALIEAATPAEPSPAVSGPARPISASELNAQNAELTFHRIFGGSLEDTCLTASITPEAAASAGLGEPEKPEIEKIASKLSDLVLSNFQTYLAEHQEDFFATIQKSKPLAKTTKINSSNFAEQLAALAREEGSVDLGKFLTGVATRDKTAMREGVRGMLGA
jgi:hypothetical protein